MSFGKSRLGGLIRSRNKANRDMKIIITARNAATGVGKTTLAIELCRFAHAADTEWSAETDGHVNINDYTNRYLSCPKGTSLLADELEHGADKRRAMSGENVRLSHSWAQLRYRNVVTVATLPTTKMLDDRMLTLSDIWINVVKKGAAIPYYVYINDFTGRVRVSPLKRNGRREILSWEDLDGDPDYKVMQEKKDTAVRGDDKEMLSADDVNKKINSAEKRAKREERTEIIERIDENYEFTQSEIGDIVGLNQSTVSRLLGD